jgi:hypothetical protein
MNTPNKEFIKSHKDELKALFQEQFDSLAKQSVLEDNAETKARLSERARENQNWINTIENIENPVKKKFTGV